MNDFYDGARDRRDWIDWTPPSQTDYDRALHDRDWAPPGGTSMNRHSEISMQFARDFTAALLEAMAEVPNLTPYDLTPRSMYPSGVGHPRAYWADHKEIAYYVSSVLEHSLHADSATQARASLWAHYVPEVGYACYPIKMWLDPPLSYDVHAQADLLVWALKRHRREVLPG